MTSTFYSGLSKDLSLILNGADDFNVVIQVDNMIIFNKPNITPSVFDLVVKYIYTGELDLTKQPGEDILGLLVSSDELLIEELFNHVQDYLIEKQTSWVQKNFVLVLHTVLQLTSCKKLQDHCLESICQDPQSFISSKKFPFLDKDILFDLLKRDDLQIEEIAAWDCLIKWGIEQTPGLESKNKISPEDFFDKIRPYKAAIPHHIYEELEEFYYIKTLPKTTTLPPRTDKSLPKTITLPPRKSKSEKLTSTIINPKLANVISNWIDRNGTSFTNNSNYKFNLIYLMSRDGLNNIIFYDKCNGQGPLIILIKVQSKDIYGGYNPIGYAGRINQWLYSTETFVFSFDYQDMHNNMKIGRTTNPSYSVYDHQNRKSLFSFGGILYINKLNLCIGYSISNYENIFGRAQSDIVEEIEVFSVIKE
ncbi:hypothetical protein RclHR1_11120001 [Rhizophagus clarus]|uniref:TLDc domain-containing protein n=1 Tax=Rhizophagus clarus TaxID=94130 RepID=A0A2Z6Q3R4_9GLOM|nr:hypothetical protein RclHR1_11120001 [Rhizophagus clarus]